MTGPQDPAAGGDRLMAGHADHEQVIEALKNALVQSRLTRDELDARAVRALAALTADTPAEAGPPSPPAPAPRRPLARAAAGSGGCLIIAFAAVWFAGHLDNPFGASPYFYADQSWIPVCFAVAFAAVVAALFILGYVVGASIEQRRSRRQRPPRPGPGGGHAGVLRVTDDAGGDGACGADVVAW
ncbi:MAG: hypothetical protein JO037_09800 [Actinobacteria bacterium]|nr:hypothetical protein [Actinomycetota bacterium]